MVSAVFHRASPAPRCPGGIRNALVVLDCGGKRSATPLSHARKPSASVESSVRPKAPSPLPLCRRSPKSSTPNCLWPGLGRRPPWRPGTKRVFAGERSRSGCRFRRCAESLPYGARIVPIRSASPDKSTSNLFQTSPGISPAASWDNSRSARNSQRRRVRHLPFVFPAMSLRNGARLICVAVSTNIPVLRTSPPSRPSRDKFNCPFKMPRFCPVIWHYPAIFGTLAGIIGIFAHFHSEVGR